MAGVKWTEFALGVLVAVHETGHFVLARFFGMRVKTFSIGFGPALWRRQPKGSHTTYQIAVIPFLAYVQIVGMNPLEDNDPKDKGSYANASLLARILTIFAGPFANYVVQTALGCAEPGQHRRLVDAINPHFACGRPVDPEQDAGDRRRAGV